MLKQKNINFENEFQELEISKFEGYDNICQDIEFRRYNDNDNGSLNWNLFCVRSGTCMKIKKECVKYAVKSLDDLTSEHKILAEIDFEVLKLNEDLDFVAVKNSTEDTLVEFLVDTR